MSRKTIVRSSISAVLAVLLIAGGITFWMVQPALASVTYGQYASTSTVSSLQTSKLNVGPNIDHFDVYLMDSSGVEKSLDPSMYSYNSSDDVIVIKNAAGVAKTFYSTTPTNPGHIIWREPKGLEWDTEGAKTAHYQFPGHCNTDSTHDATPSSCPGLFPSDAHLWPSGQYTIFNEPNLRKWDGSAVTTAYEVTPPSKFYEQEDSSGDQISNNQLQPNSIKIYNAEPITRGVTVEKTTPDDPADKVSGYGYMQLSKPLTSEYNSISFDYILQPLGDGTTNYNKKQEGRNYFMKAMTYWEGTSYLYKGRVDVYYKPTAKPDLVPISITNVDPVAIGKPVKYKLIFRNVGAAIPQSKCFNVLVGVKKPGDTGYTDTAYKQFFCSGVDRGEYVTDYFTYQTNSPGKLDFKIYVDSGNRTPGDLNSPL